MRNRWGAVVLASTVPLAVLVLDPAGWYPFGPSKWLAVSTVLPAGAALLLWSRPLRWSRPLLVVVGALLGWLALAAILADDPRYAWVGTPERHFGWWAWALCALALLVGQSLDVGEDGGDRSAVTWAAAIAGLGVGGLATAEALGWEPALFAVTPGRLTATLGSAAFLGAVTALLLPAVIGIALDRGAARPASHLRISAALAGVLLLVACLGSGARASWVGLVAAVLVLGASQARVLLAHRTRTLVAGAGAIVVLAVVVLSSPVGGRIAAAGDPDAVGGRSRVDEWRVAARVIEQHPFVGVGPEGYRIAFAEGADDAYQQAYGRDPLPDRAHSGPLDVAVTGGLPALLLWAVVVGFILRAAWRAMRAGPPWLIGLATGLVAHLVEQLLLFPTFELEPVAWLLAGVLVGATTPAADRRERLVARPFVAALATVAVVGLAVGTVDVSADRLAAVATAAARAGDEQAAVDAATAAARRRGDEVRLHLLLAQVLVDADRGTTPALAAVDDALRLSPGDPIVRRHRADLLVQRAAATHLPADIAVARAYVAQLLDGDGSNTALWLLAGAAARLAGDAPAAEAAFVRAEALAPRSPTACIELALLYLDTGRPADARAAAARALDRDPTSAPGRAIQARAIQAQAAGGR